MAQNGYYLIRCMLGQDVITYDEQKTVMMANVCFAPKFPADISKDVHMCDYLYHVVPDKFMPLIRKNGLVPQARISDIDILNIDIHYPERTYFFCGNSEKLAINYAKQDMPSGALYHVLRVKISDISPDFPMFCDPLIKDNAIYIEFSIPY